MPTELDTNSRTQRLPQQLLRLIQERQHFLVTSHARPDGDAIGSALGMMHLLETLGKKVDVAFADTIPGIYRALPGANRIRTAQPAKMPEAAILLECDSIGRTGYTAIPAAFTINIDHHQSGRNFADWNWIEPEACAVGSMLYDFAMAAGLTITPDAATCLYAAVLTDTGSFTFPCTTSATFALASHLLECGADATEVADNIYFCNPEAKIRILGEALHRMVVDGPLAWTTITLRDMQRAGATVADCEGVVNYLIGIAGVQAAVVLREIAPPDGSVAFRCSLRSKGAVDVSLVAEGFGGGGHTNASGCTVSGSAEAAIPAVLAALGKSLIQSP